ncbi:DUF397 domain-containing protein [Streptomyces sp. NBC_01236]|uniref:DUF397 domain-containing protein n=1 Tax=Streptomyces sp. NBC_01236 TaxID=2903789 RepID=UPI002E1387A2|nr:DUF397 domain-containing protein [Streptomyces sp. NBC_01236]
MESRELVAATWIKSSYSDNDGGNCVEIAPGFPDFVPVRDSKNPDGPVMVVTRSAWSAFTGPWGPVEQPVTLST